MSSAAVQHRDVVGPSLATCSRNRNENYRLNMRGPLCFPYIGKHTCLMTMPLMRSKLFVPGARAELFDKALAGEADALSFDLEDAVPEAGKVQARMRVAEFLRSDAVRDSHKVVIVRINALGTVHFAADLAAIALPRVDIINLPKCESPQDALAMAAELQLAETSAGLARPIGLLLNIETPRALRQCVQIASAHPRVAGLQLGYADLFEPYAIDRHDRANVHAAMFAVRMAAAEAGIYCCDGAFAAIDDADGFRAEAQMAHRLGYIGKTCIHPRQVAVANAVFRPNAQEIAMARRIVQAAGDAAARGQAAFAVEGRMIDPPFLRRAQAIIEAAGNTLDA